jgi:hypothetical protein
MPYTDIAKLAKCTTCHFTEDLSNYWTANLYFKARNGTYKRIPQIANEFNTGDNAGITLYYTSPDKNATTAFKPASHPTACPQELVVSDAETSSAGLPHADRRPDAAHFGEPRKEHAAVLSLLHET